MKIVTWNCNGALRKKFEALSDLDADIYIIQECEDPTLPMHKQLHEWKNNFLWIGDNKNKGIGIFAKNNIDLKKMDWSSVYKDHTVKHFLPCLINDDFQILGIWAHKNNSPNFGYIGQVWKYFQINKCKLNKILIAGDFNSNVIWDEWDRWWNHSDVINELNELNIYSLYHHYYDEQQGKESQPTFYLQRNPKKPYHIDYVFGSKEFVDRLTKLDIADMERWLMKSDHMPVICEFEM